MIGTVAAFADRVPDSCRTTHCDKDKCRVDLAGAPVVHVIVDMDCGALPIPAHRKRCDCLFVGEECNTTWVVPIELKSGRLDARTVLKQLEGGARTADSWLPQRISFQLVPLLAHGKPIPRNGLKVLRSKTIELRGQKKKTVLIKCGEQLTKALGP